MQTLNNYSQTIQKASGIYSKALPEQNDALMGETNELVETLETQAYIKVPFVGDFSAGKSSLLNAMLDNEILPTNVSPETAVSYELYYSPTEHLELHKKNNMVAQYPLEAIKTLSVKPGDVVRVFLNNPMLKNYQENGIVLVDMPGIDSGIEAHNAAITQYLGPGTRYMIFSDAEQGTIRSTALSFINELSKYEDIDFSLFLSKIDKKTPDDVARIQKKATELISSTYPNHTVGKTSAVDKNFGDVITALNSINADEILGRKYKKQVVLVLDQMIQSLQRNIQLMTGNLKDADKAMSEIEKTKNESLEKLERRKNDAQPLAGSADDIVNDIRDAIITNSSSLASLIMNNAGADQLNNAIVQVIRPVFVNSFKRELSEYQEVISSAVLDFSVDVDKILKDSDNAVLAGAENIAGALVGKDIIEGVLVKGLEKAAAKFAGYKGIGALLNGLSKILGPLVTIIVNIIPDILRMIFGKSKDQKLTEIKNKVCNEVAGRIAEGMRTEVEKLLREQREMADHQMAQLIEKEAAQVEESIRKNIEIKKKEKEMIQHRIIELNDAATQLIEQKSTI